MILWIFAFVYGRMTDELSWKPFLILAAIAAVVTYLMRSPLGLDLPVEFALNLGGFIGLFMLGYGFGLWLARRDEADS